MLKFKCLMMICLMSMWLCAVGQAQGIKDKIRDKIGSGSSSESKRDNERNDFEGEVWEFKVMDRHEKDKSKKTLMVGRIRLKQKAIFSVGDVAFVNNQPEPSVEEQAVKLMNQFDRDSDNRLNTIELTMLLKSMQKSKSSIQDGEPSELESGITDGGTKNNLQSDMKELLSERINRAKEDGTGSERIGDIYKQTALNCIFNFDQDDNYPLSGRIDVNRDSNQKGGVWTGDYDEYVDGKKRHRWRIELRKIDE